MRNQEKYPEWFLWLWESGPRLFLIAGTMLLIGIVLVALYVDSRLDRLEGQFGHRTPRNFQPPDLDDFAVADGFNEQWPLRHMVYVPAYSHVYFQGGLPSLLEVTLSIRNVSPSTPVYVGLVDYYDSQGKRVRSFLDRTIKLPPLSTIDFLVQRRDSSGGSGANFLVEWMAAADAVAPLIETVMVGPQGISFGRSGVPLPSPADGTPEANATTGRE